MLSENKAWARSAKPMHIKQEKQGEKGNEQRNSKNIRGDKQRVSKTIQIQRLEAGSKNREKNGQAGTRGWTVEELELQRQICNKTLTQVTLKVHSQ